MKPCPFHGERFAYGWDQCDFYQTQFCRAHRLQSKNDFMGKLFIILSFHSTGDLQGNIFSSPSIPVKITCWHVIIAGSREQLDRHETG